jgi:hypothetical protein
VVRERERREPAPRLARREHAVDFAALVDVPTADVRTLAAAGLLDLDGDGRFDELDVLRVWALRHHFRLGRSVDDVVRGIQDGSLDTPFGEVLFAAESRRRSLDDVAAETGLPPDHVSSLRAVRPSSTSSTFRCGRSRWRTTAGSQSRSATRSSSCSDARPTPSVSLSPAPRATDQVDTLPRLRIGINDGAVVYRVGEYIGDTVNIAARITAAAEEDEIVVTAAVAHSLDPPMGSERVGSVVLRGIDESVELFRIVEAPGEACA